MEDIDVVDGHGIPRVGLGPAQGDTAVGYDGGGEAHSVAAVGLALRRHGLQGGEGVAIVVAHREGSDVGTLFMVVERDGEGLQAVGKTRQQHFGLVAVACRVAGHHEEGLARQIAKVLVATVGDNVRRVGDIAAIPAVVPTVGQVTLLGGKCGCHSLEVLAVGHRQG